MELLETTRLPGGLGNGHRPVGETEYDWRDEALNAALAAEAMSGDSEDALLRAIRMHRPERATITAYMDRPRLLEFMRTRCQGFRSLHAASDQYDNGDENRARPYVGWYAARWREEAIEVALAPDWGDPGYIIAIAGAEETVDAFIREAARFADRPAGRCLLYAQGWQSAHEMDAEIGKVTWDDIVLPEETMARLRESVEGFHYHREAFREFGFPWKRGILLIGPPGTGKTMVCKAAAAAMPELPFLYVRDLRERNTNDSVRAIFQRARRVAPCILAFEDMDGFVTACNRSVFLNELDGFTNNDGILIIASSNHPGKIDEALLKRPSRFDRVFHIGLPATPERAEYCRRLLSRSSLAARISPELDVETLAESVAQRSDGFTPAYLKETFLSAALERVQQGDLTLDGRFAEAVLAHLDSLKRHLKKMKNPDALGEMRSGDEPISLRNS